MNSVNSAPSTTAVQPVALPAMSGPGTPRVSMTDTSAGQMTIRLDAVDADRSPALPPNPPPMPSNLAVLDIGQSGRNPVQSGAGARVAPIKA